MDKAYVYIIKCSDDSLYTGWTNNLDKRIKKHQSGTGSKYTRGRLPVTLVYYETLENRSQALMREAGIKKMTRTEKETLIKISEREVSLEKPISSEKKADEWCQLKHD